MNLTPTFIIEPLFYRYLQLRQLREKVQRDRLDLGGAGVEQLEHQFVLIPAGRRRDVGKNAAQIATDRCTYHLQQIDRRSDVTVFDFGEIDDRNADLLCHIFLC